MVRELSINEIRALNHELLLKDILATAEKLPPFPDVMWRVMALVRQMAPVNEIEAVIKYDQAITARVLALSRSAYYGRRYGVASLRDAILVLGGQTLLQVVMTACAIRYFEGRIGGYNQNQRALWEHSVAAAITAEKLSRMLKHKKLLTIYTAALLHDIGKTVLDFYAHVYLHSNLKEIRKQASQSIRAEREVLCVDHQELGKIIAERWKFPAEVVMAIGFHHSPMEAPSHRDMAALVYVADRIVSAMPHGDRDDESEPEPFEPENDAIARALGLQLTTQGLEALHKEVDDALADIQLFLKKGA